MSDDTRRRGSKPLSDRDWVFGSRPRRKLLEGVLIGPAPKSGWSRPELAGLAGVVANGGVDEHLEGLLRLGLIEADDATAGIWHPIRPHGALAKAVRGLLNALRETADAPPAQTAAARVATRQVAIRTVGAAEAAVCAARAELGENLVTELVELLAQARGRLEAA